jgi:dihydroorotate dehydrogenase
MPDWSYRTVLRPLMLRLGPERSRRLAVATLTRLSRLPFGLAAIDFLGHMRPDARLRTKVGTVEVAAPLVLGAMIDTGGGALPAFGRFGAGLIEVGPVAERANGVRPDWRVDLQAGSVIPTVELTAGVDEVAENLSRVSPDTPVCVRIAPSDPDSVRRVAERLHKHAAMFSVDRTMDIAAAAAFRPVLLRIPSDAERPEELAGAAMGAGAAGVWLQSASQVHSLRAALPGNAVIVAGGINEPEDVRRVLDAGGDAAVIDAGLVCSGPGLVKRCNEALLSAKPEPAEPEPLTLDAARRAWFWALLLGVAMFLGGLMAMVIASTRVVLPYDESLSGLTRAQMASLNPRLLPFMAHDRVSLAGAMLSLGILYAALAWSGIRRGEHWAHVTVIASATIGFLTFFFFLGFGYFDPFHAFVTAILTQFTLLCIVMAPSPRQLPEGDWRESADWRRGQWGQLLFIVLGVGLTGAGLVLSLIGCTQVFVDTDLEFMRTTAADLRRSFEHLVPLVAHDRASLGGMLIANGVAIWLSAQWGFRRGARWLWIALAWAGNIAFASAVVVHFVVGYDAVLHLAPAILGWTLWNVALLLSRSWLAGSGRVSRSL